MHHLVKALPSFEWSAVDFYLPSGGPSEIASSSFEEAISVDFYLPSGGPSEIASASCVSNQKGGVLGIVFN